LKVGLQNIRPAWAGGWALLAWVATLTATAVAACSVLVASGAGVGDPVAVGVLALLALGLERESFSLTPQLEVSVASLVYVFAAVVLGPLAGVIVASAGLLIDLPRRDDSQPILRWLTWTSGRAIVVAAAGSTAALALHHFGWGFFGLFAAVFAAFAVESVADVGIHATTTAIRGSGTWLATAGAVGPALIVSAPLQAPMVAVLAYAYTRISPWSVVLFAVPAFAAQRLLLLYRKQREDTEALGNANARLARANLSFATALVATLDARDRYTAGHSAAVAIYARDIAQRMGLSEDDQDLVHLCGLVHDVGKIGLPAGLLEKPGALSLDERRQMEQHSVIGERILRNVDDYAQIASVVRHHHERVDGNGYPDSLRGDDIPLLSRIIAVADAYNAMTSDRPYRDAMPSRVARLRLAQAVESQFDTSVVAAFEAILTSASEDYRMGTGTDFALHRTSPIPELCDESDAVELLDELKNATLVAARAAI
jgi:putative nucleotidyltransferase with HDIG domain